MFYCAFAQTRWELESFLRETSCVRRSVNPVLKRPSGTTVFSTLQPTQELPDAFIVTETRLVATTPFALRLALRSVFGAGTIHGSWPRPRAAGRCRRISMGALNGCEQRCYQDSNHSAAGNSRLASRRCGLADSLCAALEIDAGQLDRLLQVFRRAKASRMRNPTAPPCSNCSCNARI